MPEQSVESEPVNPDSREMFEVVYNRLKVVADRYVRNEHAVSLHPTSLVHEAFLRMRKDDVGTDEGQFFAFAAIAMRRILIERARQLRQLKRGGGRKRVPLSQVALTGHDQPVDVLDLDVALAELESINPAFSRVAVLRFLLGCSVDETADALRISTSKVVKDWRFARAWLISRLERPE